MAPPRCAPFDTVTESTRSGWRAANASATVPPVDSPTKWKRSVPAASATARTSSTIAASVHSNPAGTALAPWPRMSKRTSRYRSIRAGVQPSQAAEHVPRPWWKSTVCAGNFQAAAWSMTCQAIAPPARSTCSEFPIMFVCPFVVAAVRPGHGPRSALLSPAAGGAASVAVSPGRGEHTGSDWECASGPGMRDFGRERPGACSSPDSLSVRAAEREVPHRCASTLLPRTWATSSSSST